MRIPALAFAVCLAGGAAAQDYAECMGRLRADPHGALAYAESWGARSADPAAEHCAAMALGALGAWRNAASRLSNLATLPGETPTAARAEMMEQAAAFWLEVDDAGLARAALDAALRLDSRAVGALAARASLSTAEARYGEAIADLDRALAVRPGDAELLSLRAAARRQGGDASGALSDARAALGARPGDALALFEQGAAQAALGEPAAARGSWLDAIAADRDGPVGERAQLSLQAMDAP